MKSKKKYTIITAATLCIAAFAFTLNMMSDKAVNDTIPIHDGDVLVTSDEISEPDNRDSYFQELRSTLDMDRNKIISMLTEAESSASSPAEKKDAADEKLKLLNYMEEEKTIETLIKNKGLPDSFVVISDGGVNVTVNSDNLDQATVTKICEIIIRQTDKKASEIVIQDAS